MDLSKNLNLCNEIAINKTKYHILDTKKNTQSKKSFLIANKIVHGRKNLFKNNLKSFGNV